LLADQHLFECRLETVEISELIAVIVIAPTATQFLDFHDDFSIHRF
jgi:hypothetical protein